MWTRLPLFLSTPALYRMLQPLNGLSNTLCPSSESPKNFKQVSLGTDPLTEFAPGLWNGIKLPIRRRTVLLCNLLHRFCTSRELDECYSTLDTRSFLANLKFALGDDLPQERKFISGLCLRNQPTSKNKPLQAPFNLPVKEDREESSERCSIPKSEGSNGTK